MPNEPTKPASQKSDLTDVQLVTGGDGPGAYAVRVWDTAQRWFVRSADHIEKRLRPFEGLDPARPVKNAVGVAIALESLDKAWLEHAKGNDAEAAYDVFVAANIGVTALPEVKIGSKVIIPSINEAVADALTKAPATRKIATGAAKVLASGALNPEIKAACGALKPVPLAGAAINGVVGLWSASTRAVEGDYSGAGGELAVTVANVGVYAAGVVLGAALLTAGAPVLAIGGAAVGAYLASEFAAEATARVYNHYAGTNVRGSGLATVVGYAAERIPQIVDYVKKHPIEVVKNVADAVTKLPGIAPVATMAQAAINVAASWFQPAHKEADNLDAQLNVIGATLKKGGYGKILDKDGDGKIEAHEIKQFVGADGVRDLQVSARNGLTTDEVRAELKQQMTENYGKHLQGLIVEAKQKGWAPKLDSNHDGKYDMADVRANLAKTGAKLDANADGSITGGEFIHAQLPSAAKANGRAGHG